MVVRPPVYLFDELHLLVSDLCRLVDLVKFGVIWIFVRVDVVGGHVLSVYGPTPERVGVCPSVVFEGGLSVEGLEGTVGQPPGLLLKFLDALFSPFKPRLLVDWVHLPLGFVSVAQEPVLHVGVVLLLVFNFFFTLVLLVALLLPEFGCVILFFVQLQEGLFPSFNPAGLLGFFRIQFLVVPLNQVYHGVVGLNLLYSLFIHILGLAILVNVVGIRGLHEPGAYCAGDGLIVVDRPDIVEVWFVAGLPLLGGDVSESFEIIL